MLDKRKYDPEDLESLMLNKSFDELYEEEKRFVLRHTESAEEYESLRSTLLLINESKDQGTLIAPRKGMKQELMAEFASEKKKGFWIWLNSILPITEAPRRQQFALAFAVIAPLLIVTAIWLNNPNSGAGIAEVKQHTSEKAEPLKEETKDNKAAPTNQKAKEVEAAPIPIPSPEPARVIEVVEDEAELDDAVAEVIIESEGAIDLEADEEIAETITLTEATEPKSGSMTGQNTVLSPNDVPATNAMFDFNDMADADKISKDTQLVEQENSTLNEETKNELTHDDNYADTAAMRRETTTSEDLGNRAVIPTSTNEELLSDSEVSTEKKFKYKGASQTQSATEQGIDFDDLFTAL